MSFEVLFIFYPGKELTVLSLFNSKSQKIKWLTEKKFTSERLGIE